MAKCTCGKRRCTHLVGDRIGKARNAQGGGWSKQDRKRSRWSVWA